LIVIDHAFDKVESALNLEIVFSNMA
jgi:hypothetical protein